MAEPWERWESPWYHTKDEGTLIMEELGEQASLAKIAWDVVDLEGFYKTFIKLPERRVYEPTEEAKAATNLEVLSKMGKTFLTDMDTFLPWEQEARNRGISPLDYMEKGATAAVLTLLGVYGVTAGLSMLQTSPSLQKAARPFLQAWSKLGGLEAAKIRHFEGIPMYAGLPADKALQSLAAKQTGLKTVGELQKALSNIIPQFPGVLDKLVGVATEKNVVRHDILAAFSGLEKMGDAPEVLGYNKALYAAQEKVMELFKTPQLLTVEQKAMAKREERLAAKPTEVKLREVPKTGDELWEEVRTGILRVDRAITEAKGKRVYTYWEYLRTDKDIEIEDRKALELEFIGDLLAKPDNEVAQYVLGRIRSDIKSRPSAVPKDVSTLLREGIPTPKVVPTVEIAPEVIVEPPPPAEQKAHVETVKEMDPKIESHLDLNEAARIQEDFLEASVGNVTVSDYARTSGKQAALASPEIDMAAFDEDTVWWQDYERGLTKKASPADLVELVFHIDKLGMSSDDANYLIRSMTYEKAKDIKSLTSGQAMLITEYLSNMKAWDPDVPIPPIEYPVAPSGDPSHWKPSLLDYVQNMESWADRMEVKYPDSKMSSGIVFPIVQGKRFQKIEQYNAAKWGLMAIKGLSEEEMAQIQLWCEEEYRGVPHTIELTYEQERCRDLLQDKQNDLADRLGVEKRIPGKAYMPRRYSKSFLENLGVKVNKYDFSPTPYDYLARPTTYKPFFKYERSIEQAPPSARLNLFSSYMAYINQGLQAEFLDKLEATGPAMKSLPMPLKGYVTRWGNFAAGKKGFGESLLIETAKRAHIPKGATLFMERLAMDIQYFGGLGLKASFIPKNMTQFLHYLSNIPMSKIIKQLPFVFSKEGKRIYEESGSKMHYAPFMSKALPKPKGKYQDIKSVLMSFVQGSDHINRKPSYLVEYGATRDLSNQYHEGEITWDELVKGLDIVQYEPPFQKIVLDLIRKGKIDGHGGAADVMGDRSQAFTNWRYWRMVAPMLLQEEGPLMAVFQVWGYNNLDLRWRRIIERGTSLIKEGDVKAGLWQYQKLVRQALMLMAMGAGVDYAAQKVTGKKYKIGTSSFLRYILFGSIPLGLAPLPGAVVTGAEWLVHSLTGRQWLAVQKAQELKQRKNVFIPAGLALRDYIKAAQLPAGEAAMQAFLPQFRPEAGLDPYKPGVDLFESWEKRQELSPFKVWESQQEE